MRRPAQGEVPRGRPDRESPSDSLADHVIFQTAAMAEKMGEANPEASDWRYQLRDRAAAYKRILDTARGLGSGTSAEPDPEALDYAQRYIALATESGVDGHEAVVRLQEDAERHMNDALEALRPAGESLD